MHSGPLAGGAGGWSVRDDRYEISSRAGTASVTRPAADGSGGGDWHHTSWLSRVLVDEIRDDEFQRAFDAIRARIDSILAPWWNLPDPVVIAAEVDDARKTAKDLSGAASVAEGTVTGGGDIVSALGLTAENLDEMSGQTIATFKMKFLGRLGTAIGGMHAISLIQGASLAAEEGIFREARRAVAEAVDKAREACDEIVHSGSGINLYVTLTIAQWAVKGAEIYAKGGVAAVFEVPKLGLEMIKEVTSSGDVFEGEAAAYEETLSFLESALRAIDEEIKSGEKAIQDNLVKNLNQIHSDKLSYDLQLDAISSPQDITIISKPLVEEVTKTYMPSIAENLNKTAHAALGVRMAPVVTRDGSVGIGATGPSEEFNKLNWILYELLKDLGWGVEMGAKNLDLAVADLLGVDASIQAEMKKIAERIEGGSGVDPWN